MAQPANLYDKYDLTGVREDLIDKIFNTSPTETPVITAFGRSSANNTYHEWQRDSLATANKDNALIDGDDFSAQALVPTTRVGNYCQIFHAQPAVSRRANIVKKAGRAAEMAYQKPKPCWKSSAIWKQRLFPITWLLPVTPQPLPKRGLRRAELR